MKILNFNFVQTSDKRRALSGQIAVLVIGLMILNLYGCKSSKESELNLEELVQNLPASNTEEVKIEYAENFSVSYHDNYKVVDLHYKSEGRGLEFEKKLVLVQRGTDAPPKTGDLEDAWFIDIPVATVAANDDGEIIRIKSLGLIDHIAGMGGGEIYDTDLRERWEQNKIASIGYSFHSIPEPELLMSSGAELLIMHTYDDARLNGMSKLRELGINAIPHFAWGEQNFLGKAEWIKFSSLFFNKEDEANRLFEEIRDRCLSLMSQVSSLPQKKTSFLLYHPSGNTDWGAHRNDFYASYLRAVSTNVLGDDGPAHTVGITNEHLLELAKNADFWIVNSTDDEDWPPSSFLNSFESYKAGNVYHYQKRTRHEHNAYDWYETPEVRPDLVLEDLISIFYPELLPEHEPLFFQKVQLTKL